MKTAVVAFAALAGAAALAASGKSVAKTSPESPTPTPVAIPDGAGGIGFDDLGFARGLKRVLVPAGRTGSLDLLDPQTQAVTAIPGFSRSTGGKGGHGAGTTSADEGAGFLFASDRDARKLDVVDPSAKKIVASAALAAGPDYVRFVEVTREVWVTEPSAKQIEVFTVPAQGTPTPARAATIAVPDGPESLVIDGTRKRAYTHEWGGKTHAVDLALRKIIASWDNGCGGSRGIALDEKKGFLFVGCEEGKVAVLDVESGRVVGSVKSGATGVDIIAWSPRLGHLYVPGESSATVAILGISEAGAPLVLGVSPAAPGAHCAATDDAGRFWVCDPARGRLLVYEDRFPASR